MRSGEIKTYDGGVIQMRRRLCPAIKSYEGTKSQRLVGIINAKLVKRDEMYMPRKRMDAELMRFKSKMDKAKEDFEKFKQQHEKRCSGLGIRYDSYDGRYVDDNHCRIPDADFLLLQKASDWFALGKIKEAKEVWDKLMNKYKVI